jgi:ribA/ribD-fused uncharacterized protein
MITEFTGEHRFLSNFWPSEVTLDGLKFSTVEHAYQASKTLNIMICPTPGKAKRMGKTVTLREDWGIVKQNVMLGLIAQKFCLHEDLKQRLLATGNQEIVEGNNWGDTFWGVCNGVGENWLGKTIMAVREGIIKEGL